MGKFCHVNNFSYLCYMKGKTKLNTLSDKQIKGLLEFCHKYCEITFGKNNRKRTPLKMYAAHSAKGQKKTCGWYCPFSNEITIFIKTCKTVREFTSTFLHEYTHYMQPCRTKYAKLLKQHGYEKHPFEIQAFSTEKFYNKKLLSILRQSYKLKNQ
jgi:uncharacterized protein YjaZ